MKHLFSITITLLACAPVSSLMAQNTVTTKRQVCVEARNEVLPMASLGNIPANAKFVGNIAPDPTYFCESAKTVLTQQQASTVVEQAVPMSRPTRRRADPKR